jgi:phosphoribosyl 1,2-cyclic phosphate phosphodiesterase
VLESGDRTRRILIDTPPELRLQLLAAGIADIDAVWFTHDHADHTHGIDDLRVFSARRRHELAAWADPVTAASLRRKFRYIFDVDYHPPVGTTKPELSLHEFDPAAVQSIAGFDLIPLRLPHGDTDVFGFRAGALGYVTDAKRIPPEAAAALAGVRILVLNALWSGNPHPTHFNLEEALEVAHGIGAERTYLTHMTHRLRHDTLAASLPPGVEPAYDGLIVDIPDQAREST